MTIMDKLTEFADAVSVAGAAGTALIGDVVDIQDLRDIGQSHIYCNIMCAADIITGGAAGTIAFQLASDAQAAIATNGSASVHFATGTFVTDDAALNELNAGDLIASFMLPLEAAVAYERYLGILAVIATTTVTAGSINAFLSLQPLGAARHYPDAIN